MLQMIYQYAVRLRWAGDCAALWPYGLWPLMVCIGVGLYLQLGFMVWLSSGALLLLFLGVGLAAYGGLDRPDGVIESAISRDRHE